MSGSFYKINTFYFLSLFLFAEAQQPVLKNYTVKDGLPSMEVYCVFQDSKGFVWLGTDGGVLRYHGYTFKNYSVKNGLADNTILGLSKARMVISGSVLYPESYATGKTIPLKKLKPIIVLRPI